MAHFKTHADARPIQTKSFTSGPNGGVTDSLDEAKAAFRAAGERQRLLSKGGADEKPLGLILSAHDPIRDMRGFGFSAV